MLFGYIAIIPLAKIIAGEDEDETAADEVQRAPDGEQTTESADDALGTLRERYAEGELTDAQFERKLERILEVETVEDASQYHESDRSWNEDHSGSGSATRRNCEAEPE